MPEWQIVMVGPVVKIDPATLPQRPNIHYFGQRATTSCRAIWRAGTCACCRSPATMSTRFISPTKTLEYMAAEMPIVSTPITDVAEPYGDIVYLGGTAEEFIAPASAALAAAPKSEARRVDAMREVLAGTSWDMTLSRRWSYWRAVSERHRDVACS